MVFIPFNLISILSLFKSELLSFKSSVNSYSFPLYIILQLLLFFIKLLSNILIILTLLSFLYIILISSLKFTRNIIFFNYGINIFYNYIFIIIHFF